MPDPTLLTAERLRSLLHYDPDTGLFTWRMRRRGVQFGSTAGTPHNQGYVTIRVDGCRWLAHRLAWLYVTGEHPPAQVDHENGIRHENWWLNLRAVDYSGNQQNLKGPRRIPGRTTWPLGVTYDEARRKFHARIKINGRQIYLGRHSSPEEAHAAYLAAKRELHPFGTL